MLLKKNCQVIKAQRSNKVSDRQTPAAWPDKEDSEIQSSRKFKKS